MQWRADLVRHDGEEFTLLHVLPIRLVLRSLHDIGNISRTVNHHPLGCDRILDEPDFDAEPFGPVHRFQLRFIANIVQTFGFDNFLQYLPSFFVIHKLCNEIAAWWLVVVVIIHFFFNTNITDVITLIIISANHVNILLLWIRIVVGVCIGACIDLIILFAVGHDGRRYCCVVIMIRWYCCGLLIFIVAMFTVVVVNHGAAGAVTR
mmetsp:Transcript_17749/g.50281  ORF Transcript_17749/g.50281 Transcript_17749/m.50281 type:complete len:206 (+) Transcript_17749:748-1365(+)